MPQVQHRLAENGAAASTQAVFTDSGRVAEREHQTAHLQRKQAAVQAVILLLLLTTAAQPFRGYLGCIKAAAAGRLE